MTNTASTIAALKAALQTIDGIMPLKDDEGFFYYSAKDSAGQRSKIRADPHLVLLCMHRVARNAITDLPGECDLELCVTCRHWTRNKLGSPDRRGLARMECGRCSAFLKYTLWYDGKECPKREMKGGNETRA